MKERQLMQKNLARLLKEVQYRSCGSQQGDQDTEQSPVNPFQKRVFDKKIRRSSVTSQNINPNSSILVTEGDQRNQQQKIKQLIRKGKSLLQELEKITIQQCTSIGVKSDKTRRKTVDNVESTINFLSNHIAQYYRMTKPAQSTCFSINQIQSYQCQSQNSRYENSENSKINRKSSAKGGNKRLGGSSVNTSQKGGQSKSVYQSVLQERRSRKSKKNRIV